MRIGVLAWGSLIWKPDTLTIEGAFEPIGPVLPIEFSRVSDDGRLSLVIDEVAGAPCVTYVASSVLSDLDAALANLWLREGGGKGTPPNNIRGSGRVGFVDLVSGQASEKARKHHPRAVEAAEVWGKSNGYDAAIWTALASNFHEKTARAFSLEAALSYLHDLDADRREAALEYFRKAPPEVQTPLRRNVEQEWPPMARG